MKFTRRDLLAWSAGAAAGLIVTPVPWKLLDDTSIWSQNWPWIPQPARGPVEVKRSFCTLCPKGCALRVRMAAGWPVGVAGVPENPVMGGALCPLAYGAHQLIWHPARAKCVRHRGSASSWDEAHAAFTKACGEGPVVIVDGYPRRAVSQIFEEFLKDHSGEYRVVYSPETRSLLPYEKWSGVPATALGYDLENARTIVSFEAPLLDGWGSPGRFTHLWAERAASQSDPQLRLIQIDAEFSRTAARAWKWIPVRPGSEFALAAGVARVLLEEQLVHASGPWPPMSLSEAADQTGISQDSIGELARIIVAQRPVVAIARDENPGVAALNVLLGAINTPGGIIRRSRNSMMHISADEPIRSARAVLLDSSVPWDFVPQTDAEIFRFAAWDGGVSKADWLLPAPGFLEEFTDIPSSPASAMDTYAIAGNLVKSPFEMQSSAQFLRSIDSKLSAPEEIIHRRCSDLFKQRTGVVHAKSATPVVSFASAQKFEEELEKGAVWVNDPSGNRSFKARLDSWPAEKASHAGGTWSAMWDAPILPQLASKLYRESTVREAPERRNA